MKRNSVFAAVCGAAAAGAFIDALMLSQPSDDIVPSCSTSKYSFAPSLYVLMHISPPFLVRSCSTAFSIIG